MSDEPLHPAEDLRGRRVTVVGLGRFGGGIGAARWLCGQGAKVTVSDRASEADLGEGVAELENLPIDFHLGGHRHEDFLDADLLVVSPAVPNDMPLLNEARRAGVEITSEMNLFLARCRGKLVGITGSVGKSTTTAMTGEILQRRFTTHVGGNIGRSLLDELHNIQPDDVAVVELSSFQLENLPRVARSPHVALVTNLQPNHLDRHGDMTAYAEAKKNIFRFQKPGDVLILNRDDEAVSAWAEEAPARVAYFSADDEPFELLIPGRHNQANAQAAWRIAEQLGMPREESGNALRRFAGLEHRLEFVGEVDGIRYFNDSKCTTPGGAIVALDAFEPGRAVLLLGGSDKGLPFDDLARRAAERARAVVAFGATRGQILRAIRQVDDAFPAKEAADLPSAMQQASQIARPGDAILLSPACASYDQFRNYEQRGEEFRRLATKRKT